MDRYYVSSGGGRGWVKCHIIVDRSTVPHTVPGEATTGPYKIGSKASATKACVALNEATGPFWRVTPAERDSLTRLREWAASTKAFTEAQYDPHAAPALVREAA
jgi:hypothetical protein